MQAPPTLAGSRHTKRSEVPVAQTRRHHEAFLAAARNGEFDQLLAVLDPDVVLRADRTAVARFCRRARGAVPALLGGAAAVAWMPEGQLRVLFKFTAASAKITAIDLIADPDHLRQLDLIAPLG